MSKHSPVEQCRFKPSKKTIRPKNPITFRNIKGFFPGWPVTTTSHEEMTTSHEETTTSHEEMTTSHEEITTSHEEMTTSQVTKK